MRILHPTDFSTTAEKARCLALDLHRRLGATIDVVHVQTGFSEAARAVNAHGAPDIIDPDRLERQREARALERQHVLERLRQLSSAGGQPHLLWGHPVKELLELAPHYDLIVMGAHGANRLDNAFLGGVAGRLLRRSPVPILTVREEASVSQLRRLLVATDFGEASKAAWRWCQPLAETGIKLVASHVIDIARLQDDTGYIQVVTEALHNLDRTHSAERHLIRQGAPLHDLPTIAQEIGADAIVIGLKRHPAAVGLVMGSLADALLRSSPVPMLSVPV